MTSRIVLAVLALAVSGSASAAAGDPLAQIGSSGSGPGELRSPSGAAVDSDGSLYVADTGNDRIQVFSRSGQLLRAWGSHGSGSGQLDGPTGIAVSGSSVYVADTNNDRIQVFDTAGNPAGTYGGLRAPRGVACDGMYLYVADTGNHRVLVWAFDDYGVPDPWVPNAGEGSGPDQWEAPTGIAVGPGGQLYVVDAGNDRVLAVGVGYLGTTGAGDGQLSRPAAVAVDGGGNVYVSDAGNGRVEVFSPAGAFLATFASPGAGAGQLASPAGVAYDRGGGRVVVADSGNDRLQAFAAMTTDVAVTAMSFPGVVTMPAQPAATVTLTNLGPGMPGSTSVYAYLSTDAVLSWNDSLVCTGYLSNVAPGDAARALSCSLPVNAIVPGTYYVIVRATASNGVADTNPANDTRVAGIVQVNGPDLVVSAVSVPPSVGTLQPLAVSATVANAGPGTAAASIVQLQLVPSSGYYITLGNVPVGALAPGAQQTVSATYTVPWNLSGGTYTVRAVADAGGAVRESNETNNQLASAPMTLSLPDVLVTAAVVPPLVQGATANLTLTVSNQGLGNARPFSVAVVLTRDGDVCNRLDSCDDSDDDWWIGSAAVPGGLAAGAQVTITVPTSIPAGFPPLAWNVFTVVDHAQELRESNVANDIAQWGSANVQAAPSALNVAIDIKPGSTPNSINLGSGGVVPVAILSSATFDATTVDPLSVTLESSPIVLRGNGTPSVSVEDVNGDGLADLVVHVATSALQLTTTSTSAVLQGRTYAGVSIVGRDDVNVVP